MPTLSWLFTMNTSRDWAAFRATPQRLQRMSWPCTRGSPRAGSPLQLQYPLETQRGITVLRLHRIDGGQQAGGLSGSPMRRGLSILPCSKRVGAAVPTLAANGVIFGCMGEASPCFGDSVRSQASNWRTSRPAASLSAGFSQHRREHPLLTRWMGAAG